MCYFATLLVRSLRKYPIPDLIWGGDEDCGHEWGDEIIARANDSNRGSMEWTTGGNPAAKVLGVKPSQGAFCRRCNAWRGQLGLEPTVDLYVAHIVAVFREVRRVLRRDGTLWLNIGDSYYANGVARDGGHGFVDGGKPKLDANKGAILSGYRDEPSLKPKDLCMIPARVALALQADGWYLRSEITWCKRAPMPESVTDRPTSATEKIYLLSKSDRYYYDADAVREKAEYGRREWKGQHFKNGDMNIGHMGTTIGGDPSAGRNMRNFWLLGPEAFPDAHFAVYPTEIPRRAIMAGTSERGCCAVCGAPWRRVVEIDKSHREGPRSRGGNYGDVARTDGTKVMANGYEAGRHYPRKDLGWRSTCAHGGDPVPCTVLDPFLGSGCTGEVAESLGRRWIGLELSEEYQGLARKRTAQKGLFA